LGYRNSSDSGNLTNKSLESPATFGFGTGLSIFGQSKYGRPAKKEWREFFEGDELEKAY